MKLDYSLTDVEDRKREVQKIVDESDYLSQQQLGYLADYLLYISERKQTGIEKKKEYPVITKNREVTVNKRQISYEEAAASLTNGEDGLYSMIIHDKNVLMDNRSPITEKDIEEIPSLEENLEVIEKLKEKLTQVSGKRKYQIKKQIISKYQELYTIKSSYTNIPGRGKANAQIRLMAYIALPENVTIDEEGKPQSDALISLFNPVHVSFLLKNYQLLKQESWEDLHSDMRWLLIDLENLVDITLREEDILYDLIIWQVDGCTGQEICKKMEEKYGIVHSEQYFSTLWCKKIPKMIAEQAQKQYLIWYYTYKEPQKGRWRICRRCGKTKLAHPLFFHKNTSKDGFYSICKECRSKKKKGDK